MSGTKRPVEAGELAKVTGGAQHQGTDASETFQTGNADDLILAGGGHDHAFTGGGNDQVQAGAGDDYVDTGSGNDLVFGGDGNDTVVGGAGADQVQGGAGNDFVLGADRDGAQDLVFGGAGNDGYTWSPGSGADQFHGESGRDTLYLSGVSQGDLSSGLQIYENGLTMKVQDGMASFVNGQGQPQTFSGQLTVGGQTLQFFGVEQMHIGTP